MEWLKHSQQLGRGIAGLLLSLVLSFPAALAQGQPGAAPEKTGTTKAASDPSDNAKALRAEAGRAAFVRLPLYFEPNAGQAGEAVKFVSRGLGYELFLTPQETIVTGRRADGSSAVLRMSLEGAMASPRLSGISELPGKASYFLGGDAKQWQSNLPTYRKVKYEQVYPGVDLVYYGNQQQLEYDFVVAPGVDPGAIHLRLNGAEQIELSSAGDLVAHASAGDLVLHKPVVYQQRDERDGNSPTAAGSKDYVEGRFVLRGSNEVSFAVGAYDAARALIIDPAVNFSTFLGGSAEDAITGVAVDTLGRMYVTGWTRSSNLAAKSLTRSAQAVNAGPFGPCAPARQLHCGGDVFVARISADGSTLEYATFLGGAGIEYANGIAVDSAFRAIIVGVTESNNFPVTASAFKPEFPAKGVRQGFLSVLDATGTSLVTSTHIGGSKDSELNAVALDSFGNVFVAGSTLDADLAATPGAPQRMCKSLTMKPVQACAFVAELLAPDYAKVPFLTLHGGSNGNTKANAIVVDRLGAAYVTGTTTASDLPASPSAVQPAYGGNGDAFVVKYDKTGALTYATYLGGSGTEKGQAIAVDFLGQAYVTGGTSTDNAKAANKFPITAGVFQPNFGGGSANCQATGVACGDAFVTAIDPTGTRLVFSTYFGGGGDEQGMGIGLDANNQIYVSGMSDSINLSVTPNAFQTKFAGGTEAAKCGVGSFCGDAFLASLSAGGNRVLMTTYLGGSGDDAGTALAVSPKDGAVVAAGVTASSTFPTMQSRPGVSPMQSALGGISNGFLVQVTPQAPPACTLTWVGVQSAPPSSWNTPGKWSNGTTTGFLPGPNDRACLGGAKLIIDTTLPVANQTVGAVDSQLNLGSLTISSGASFTLTNTQGDSQINDLIFTNATLNVFNLQVRGNFQFNGGTITVNGTNTSSGTLAVSGMTTCTGGTLNGPDGFEGVIAGGGLNLTGILNVDKLRFFNSGAGTMSGAATQIVLTNGAEVINFPASATFDVKDSAGIRGTAGFEEFNNNGGTFITSVAGNTTTMVGRFVNNGTINVNAGTLMLDGGFSTSGGGSIHVASGATLELGGSVSMAPQNVDGAGTVIWNPATFAVISGGLDINLNPAPGTYNVTGTTIFNGKTSFQTSVSTMTVTNMGTTTLNKGASVTFSAFPPGATTVTVSNPITMNTGSVLTNSAGSTMTFTNDSGIPASDNTPIFNNMGTLIKSGGAGAPGTVIGAIFNHTGGSFEINVGSVTLQNGGTIGSRIDLLSGGNVNFAAGKFTASAVLNGPVFGGGIFSISQGATMDLQSGATLEDASMNNSGAVTLSGNFSMFPSSGPAIFNNQAGASFTITNDSSITTAGTSAVFNNLGQFTKAAGALSPGSTIGATFNHTGGALSINAGALILSGGGMFSAPSTVAAGAMLTFSAGTFNLGSLLTGPGTYEIDAATVNFNAGAASPAGANAPTLNLVNPGVANVAAGVTLNLDLFKMSGGMLNGPATAVVTAAQASWSGGTIAGAGTLNLTFLSSFTNNLVDKGWTINNSGLLSQSGSGNTLTANQNAVLNNLAAGTWDFGDFVFVGDPIGANGSTFNNFGKLTKSLAGPGPLTLSMLFNNQAGANFTIQAGAVSLLGTNNCGAGNCPGAYTLVNGTQLSFNGGNFLVAGPIAGAGASVTVQSPNVVFPVLDLLGPGAINVGNVAIGSRGTIIVEKLVNATLQNVSMTGGGVLTGTGTVTGNVVNTSGTVQPGPQGAGLGTLTVMGNFTQAVGGTLQEIIAGQGLGAGGAAYDQLVVTGTANVSGTITGTLVAPYLPPVPKVGDQLLIVSTPGASGSFSTNNIQSPAGLFWNIANTANGVVATLATPAQLMLTPSPVPFGNQRVNTPGNPVTVTLTNPTAAAVTLANANAVQISGANAADFTIKATGTTCMNNTIVQPTNGTCVILIIFTPGGTGPRTATLTVTSNGNPAMVSVTLNGAGTAPVAGAAPSPLAFGTQAKGTTSAPKTVTVSNTGNDTLNLAAANAVTITGANAGDFAIVVATTTCNNAIAVTQNSTCVINITFTPSTTAAETATLTITDDSNGVAGSTQTVTLTGTGTGPAQALVLAPSPVNFPNQRKGTKSATITVTVTNNAATAVHLAAANAVTLTGANAVDFAIGAPSSGTACANGATVAANGGVCTIGLTVTPSVVGAETATLNVADDATGSPQTDVLNVTGTFPTVSLSQTSLTFGPIATGTTTAAQTVTLMNTGTDALHFTAAVSLGGTNPGDFAVAAGTTCILNATVAPNGTCVIKFTFTPAANGSFTAMATVTDDANPTTQTITLTGTTPPTASLSATSLTYTSQGVGTASASQTITITNNGGAALVLAANNAVAIAGTNAADFSVASGTTCINGANVAGSGGTCVIIIVFTPGGVGSRGPATVTVTDNASPATQTITLNGTGIDFTVTIPSATMTVAAGTPATFMINVAPGANGFASAITFSASGLPGATTATFNPPSLTPNGAAASTQLTLTTTKNGAVPPLGPFGDLPRTTLPRYVNLWLALLLAIAAATLSARKVAWARRYAVLLPLLLIATGAVVLSGCSGGGGGKAGGTPAGTYTITVSAKAGSLTHTGTVTLTVTK